MNILKITITKYVNVYIIKLDKILHYIKIWGISKNIGFICDWVKLLSA